MCTLELMEYKLIFIRLTRYALGFKRCKQKFSKSSKNTIPD